MFAHPSLLHEVIPLVREVGQYLRHHFGRVATSDIQIKDRNSLVSYVDITAERMLIDGLQKITPQAGYITEEGTVDQAESQDQVWVIDPLDGTTNFLHGIPFFSISVALQETEGYTLGVVLDVMHDACFAAVKGAGAQLDGTALHVSNTALLSGALLATGYPYSKMDHAPVYLEVFNALIHATRGMRRIGSAALDLAYVAAGRFDGYYEYGLNAWDIAAGICIVREAGGVATSFHGGEIDPTASILASNGHLHQELLNHMAPYRHAGMR